MYDRDQQGGKGKLMDKATAIMGGCAEKSVASAQLAGCLGWFS